MGAPVFTAAELDRAMSVAKKHGMTVEICPRRKTMRLVPIDGQELPSRPTSEGVSCDELFGRSD